jgi:hypothetical protein
MRAAPRALLRGNPMSLADLWRENRAQLLAKQIQQIIPFAGEGKLRDGSTTSAELRELLSLVPLDLLKSYADQCLQESFTDSGLALQDIVNQVGTRLGFSVEYGRYHGVRNQPGHDGLWASEDGRAILVEVKTTDAYRIDLNTLAGYRKTLIQAGKISEANSSILIVVGRQNTGDLEAQVRGSKHAWDIRMISVQALLKLMSIKERLENPLVLKQIRSILTPQEFTRVDGIIDVVFLAAEDVTAADGLEEEAAGDSEDEPGEEKEGKQDHVAFNAASIEHISRHLQKALVKETRVTWRSPDNAVGVLCKVSRAYRRPNRNGYWFSVHSTPHELLGEVRQPYIAFGCGSPDSVLLIPYGDFLKWTEGLNFTRMENGECYWHIRISEEKGRFHLLLKKGFPQVDLSPYLLKTAGA